MNLKTQALEYRRHLAAVIGRAGVLFKPKP
jgi:hypothetical protein